MTNYGVTNEEGDVTQVAPEDNPQASPIVQPGAAPEVVGNSAPAEGDEVVANSQPADAPADDDKDKELAEKVAAQEAQLRAENPNAVIVRAANPEIGGESF